MMIQNNRCRFSLLATLTLLFLLVVLTVVQLTRSTKTYAQGNSLAIVQVKHTITFAQHRDSSQKPQLKVTPDRQGTGSYFYLSGAGFLSNEQVKVYWQESTKSIYLGQAVADSSGGMYYAGFYTPKGLAPGDYTILLQRANSVEPKTLTVPFHILAPAMVISHLTANSPVLLLHLTNFAAYETLNISWNANGGQQLGSTNASYNGEGYFSFVPPAAPKGTFQITVKGHESGLRVSKRISW